MANTYVLISSSTVGSGGASSIIFSSIPQTYTDLMIMHSARATTGTVAGNVTFSFNGSSANFTDKYMYGDGASATSGSTGGFNAGSTVGSTATANTFGNTSIYIPNYTSSNYKSFSVDSVDETNATTTYAVFIAGLWSQTAAITSITLTCAFAQYSTAYLYGIKNS